MELYKWIIISIKMQMKNYRFWLVLIVSLVLLSVFKIDESNEIIILNQCDDLIIDVGSLNNYKDYSIVEVDNIHEFKERIKTNQSMSGFLIKKDAYDRISNGLISETVEYYYQTDNDISANIKEKIYAQIFSKYSEMHMKNITEKYFSDNSDEVFRYLVDKNHMQIKNTDLIEINVIKKDDKENKPRNINYSLIISSLIVLSVILTSEITDSSYQNVYEALEKNKAILYKLVNILVDISMYFIILAIGLFLI